MTDKADKAKKEDAKEEEWTRKDKEDRYEQLLSYWCLKERWEFFSWAFKLFGESFY